MKISVGKTDALVVVDMQKDFMPGGSLPVPGGDEIVPRLNEYMDLFVNVGAPVFFTRDWHPEGHVSFKGFGGVWPEHCIKGTSGAEFVDGLKLPGDNKFIISKGTSIEFDAYSGFQGTVLEVLLRERGVWRIFVGGVATDFCVKHTVVGGLNLGFQVFLLLDAIKGVINPDRAINEMIELGATGVELMDFGGGNG